ncbi:MAG: XRE family transcriptional regulator [Clostridia bacterium]|nr:XRE family transcriptional regulator [Clostridia bacterium]
MEEFKDIIKELIEEKEKSLRAISRDSEISTTQYSDYLKGVLPTIDTAVKLSNYFKCSLDYLFGISEINYYKEYVGYDLTKFVPRYLEALKQNKISHWKFAQKCGFGESSLRHWRDYGKCPSVKLLIIIASNLDVSVDYLIGRY